MSKRAFAVVLALPLWALLPGCGQGASGSGSSSGSGAVPGPSASSPKAAASAPAAASARGPAGPEAPPELTELGAIETSGADVQALANAAVVCEGACVAITGRFWVVDERGVHEAPELRTAGAWEGHDNITVHYGGAYPGRVQALGMVMSASDPPYSATRALQGGKWVDTPPGWSVPPSDEADFPVEDAHLAAIAAAPGEIAVRSKAVLVLGPGAPVAASARGVHVFDGTKWSLLPWPEKVELRPFPARLTTGGVVIRAEDRFFFLPPSARELVPLPVPAAERLSGKLLWLESELWLTYRADKRTHVVRTTAKVARPAVSRRDAPRWGKTAVTLAPLAKADDGCKTPFVRLGTSPLSSGFEKELAPFKGKVELASLGRFYEVASPFVVLGIQPHDAADAKRLAEVAKAGGGAPEIFCLDLASQVKKVTEPAANVRIVPVHFESGTSPDL